MDIAYLLGLAAVAYGVYALRRRGTDKLSRAHRRAGGTMLVSVSAWCGAALFAAIDFLQSPVIASLLLIAVWGTTLASLATAGFAFLCTVRDAWQARERGRR